MANNYLQFSEILIVGSDDKKEWLEDYLKPWQDEIPPRKNSTKSKQFLAWCKQRQISPEDAKIWPNFEWSFCGEISPEEQAKAEKDPSYIPIQTAPWELWIRAEEFGTPEHAANVVQAFFRKFGIDSVFGLTWAETCSKLRAGEFSGGGFFVTPFGKKVIWITPYMLFNKIYARFKRKVGKVR